MTCALPRPHQVTTVVLTWVLVFASSFGPAVGQQPAISLYGKAKAAAVEILVNGHLNGSGWFVDSMGLIFTAAHVIERPGQALEITSPLVGRRDAKLVAVDLGHDLALLKVDPHEGGYPALRLAERPPGPGEEVFLMGSPLFRHAVLVRGVIARDAPVFEYYEGHYVEVTHCTATVPNGMSGGPWLNSAAEVVGLQSGVMSQNSLPVGIAFVTPLKALRRLSLSRQTAATPALGASVEELWQQDRKTLERFPRGTEGLLVRVLQEDGPAARGSLKQWDMIVAADGKRVRLVDELVRIMVDKQPGQALELTVMGPDGTGEREARLTLGKLEASWP